ncbi:hypothetical protein WCX18_02730 [Sulfurimonas sp. HSL1-2]|uniref:hypothetical protein n=1 Tax=Thiomicrolovo zhangzhouensis TaxID=3131933 RepID=UPI0031F98639
MRLFLLAAAFAGLLSAGVLQLFSPVDAVTTSWTKLPTDTEMQTYALSIAFKDPHFRERLDGCHTREEDRNEVERAVAEKLKARPKRSVSNFSVRSLGKEHCSTKFLEDGKQRMLYVRKIGDIWKIDNRAGRSTPKPM